MQTVSGLRVVYIGWSLFFDCDVFQIISPEKCLSTRKNHNYQILGNSIDFNVCRKMFKIVYFIFVQSKNHLIKKYFKKHF